MSNLVPTLIKRNVKVEKLILDPNNPRLITRSSDTCETSESIDRVIQTHSKMCGDAGNDPYRIKELENSIKMNGWWPIDFIFVKKLDDSGRFLVLEGNRRVTAIQNIRNDENADKKIRDSLETIDVMEIVDNCSEEMLQKKITYLLGVRHHGSLKSWSPFAQANNIYQRYLELTGMNSENFIYEKETACVVGDALSIETKEVEKRLKVFRAMCQLGEMNDVKNSNGGMEDRYYSLCEGVLISGSKELKKYINQDSCNFLLDQNSLYRFNNLCSFDKPGRAGAPIANPHEWRKFSNILKDENKDKKETMLKKVEVEKKKPSDVWAERAAELQTLQWDRWLNKVNSILKQITLADDLTSDSAKAVTVRLNRLIEFLEAK